MMTANARNHEISTRLWRRRRDAIPFWTNRRQEVGQALETGRRCRPVAIMSSTVRRLYNPLGRPLFSRNSIIISIIIFSKQPGSQQAPLQLLFHNLPSSYLLNHYFICCAEHTHTYTTHTITHNLIKMKTATILALIPLVAGHGAIIKATAPGGGSGMALGVDTATPRDGTRRDPFQADSTRFKGANAATVGQTVGGGENDLEAGTKAIMAETGDQLPQIAPGGEIQMTVHQVNGDGAGPYDCMVNADGTATTWTNIQVTTNVPGDNGRNRVSFCSTRAQLEPHKFKTNY